MAIGDGFNDIAMLKEADVGIQLYNKEVPLIFGDIVIKRLESISHLLFVRGRDIHNNLALLNFYNLSISPIIAFMMFYACISSNYSGIFLN